MLNLKTDIYTTPIILGNFSVAKVIIIFGNNKHIKDFFEKKIIAYLEKRKSPCSVQRQIGNTAREIYNIGDIFIQGSFYRKAIVSPAMTILTIDISLIRIFSEGPEVSLNGSPTVSPTMVAL